MPDGPAAPRIVRVYVCATDPVLEIGATTHLAHAALELVSGEHAICPETVVVVVAETVDTRVEVKLVRLAAYHPRGTVLVTAALDQAGFLRALRHGVTTVLWRRLATPETLRHTVATVANGHALVPPEMLGPLLRELRQRWRKLEMPAGHERLLSDRERDVLRLVAQGNSTQEIAATLSYSERTIKTTLQSINTRFALRNRSHAVAHLTALGEL